MKYTLLELVQDILSSMDSDEVDSINDTVESQQVVKVIRTAYFEIINRAQLPEHFDLRQLEDASASAPVLMDIPSDISEVKWIKYDQATTDDPEINMQLLTYKSLKDFLDMTDRLDTSASDVDSFSLTVDGDVHTVLYKNNGGPRYYTTTDDGSVLFDSVNLDVETFLDGSKTKAYCRITVDWEESDDFTPDLDDTQFQLLLNEAKSLAWMELKQSPHPKAEQGARRAWSQLQKNKDRVVGLTDFNKLPHFGRL